MKEFIRYLKRLFHKNILEFDYIQYKRHAISEEKAILDNIYEKYSWNFNFNKFPKCLACGKQIIKRPIMLFPHNNSFAFYESLIFRQPLCYKHKKEFCKEAWFLYRDFGEEDCKDYVTNVISLYSYCCCSGSDLR